MDTGQDGQDPGCVKEPCNNEHIEDIDDKLIGDKTHDEGDGLTMDDVSEYLEGTGTAGFDSDSPCIPPAATTAPAVPSISFGTTAQTAIPSISCATTTGIDVPSISFSTTAAAVPGAKGKGKAGMEAVLLERVQKQTHERIQEAYRARKKILVETAEELKLSQLSLLAFFREQENEDKYYDDDNENDQDEEVGPGARKDTRCRGSKVRQGAGEEHSKEKEKRKRNSSKNKIKEPIPLPLASDAATMSKYYLRNLTASVGIPIPEKSFPWEKLSLKLAKSGFFLRDWPAGAPFPSQYNLGDAQETSRRQTHIGIRGLKAEFLQAIVAAFETDNPPRLVKGSSTGKFGSFSFKLYD